MFPLIKIDNLSKTYENEGVQTRALCGVSFSIDRGEFVSIMGPSGSGKSTLMQILGLLDKATEGYYFLGGKDVTTMDEDEMAEIRNKTFGFVFQAFNLLPRTTVFENVELPLLYDNRSGKDNKEKVLKALQAVGIDHRKDYFSNQLSGGEKQRVAIARALVNDPEVIFADEPTGNLDSKTGVQVMEIFEKLNQMGHTVILVTHETVTASYAKRIIKVLDGNIVSDKIISEEKRKLAEMKKKIK